MSDKILVVDDDEVTLAIVSQILEDHGLDHICVESGEQALETLAGENIRLIVLDQQMPGMSGDDVLHELQKDDKSKKIPVVMLTGLNHISDVSSSFELGAQDYVVKPFDSDNFALRVKKLLGE